MNILNENEKKNWMSDWVRDNERKSNLKCKHEIKEKNIIKKYISLNKCLFFYGLFYIKHRNINELLYYWWLWLFIIEKGSEKQWREKKINYRENY